MLAENLKLYNKQVWAPLQPDKKIQKAHVNTSLNDSYFSFWIQPSLKGEGWIRTRAPRKSISHDKQWHMHFLAPPST